MLRDTLRRVRQHIYLILFSPDYLELIEYRLKQSITVKINGWFASGESRVMQLSFWFKILMVFIGFPID